MEMRYGIVTTLVLLATFGVANAGVEQHYEEKKTKIRKAGPFDKDKQVVIRVGKNVTFAIAVYQDEFFGHTTISANAKMKNTTKQKVKAIYSISFHDKDGKLVGCHQGSWDLDAGEDINYGSGIIYADAKSIASVTSYKLRTQVMKANK